MNSVNAHLRDMHGYSLAESVRWSPQVMFDVHQQEHQDHDCGHPVEEIGGER